MLICDVWEESLKVTIAHAYERIFLEVAGSQQCVDPFSMNVVAPMRFEHIR